MVNSSSGITASKIPVATAPSFCKQCANGDAALAENNTNPMLDGEVDVTTGGKIDNEADITYPITFLTLIMENLLL